MENTNNVKLFNKLKNLIFKAEKFGDAKLEDGRIINWEGEFTIGTILNVVSEDGSVSILEPNEYIIDNKSVKVGEVGDILEISDIAEEVEDEVSEDMATEVVTEDVAPIVTEPSDIEKILKMLEDMDIRLKTIEDSQKMNNEFKEDFNAVKELVKIIANEPIEKTNVKDQNFNKIIKKSENKFNLVKAIMENKDK